MSVHVEWMSAESADVTLRLYGERYDGEDPDDDQISGEPRMLSEDEIPAEVGIVIAGDDVVVLTGSAHATRDTLARALALVDAHITRQNTGSRQD